MEKKKCFVNQSVWDINVMDRGTCWRVCDCEEQKKHLPKRPWRKVPTTVTRTSKYQNENINDAQR